ncbi:MAG: LytTR family DNA-binding domain-containing protein, partial [Pseudomonadota bacterium]
SHSKLELVGCFCNLADALPVMCNETIDVLFLDIELPETSGFDFVKSMLVVPQVVFVTAHEKYAADAFNYDVTDYIVKPITPERFEKAVVRALRAHSMLPNTDSHVFLEFLIDRKKVKLRADDIFYFESYGDYVQVNLFDSTYLISSALNRIIKTVPESLFVRVHRRYIVNLSKVSVLAGYTLTLSNEQKIPISRSQIATVRSRLELGRVT